MVRIVILAILSYQILRLIQQIIQRRRRETGIRDQRSNTGISWPYDGANICTSKATQVTGYDHVGRYQIGRHRGR